MITVIDSKKLKELLSSFYNLTGIKVAIYDSDYEEILAYPEGNALLCDMVRESEFYCGECQNSARRMCIKCAEEKKAIVETCHVGLTEAVAPLSDGISIIGYIMVGQITNIPGEETLARQVNNKCKKYNLRHQELRKALKNILYYSDKQLDDATKVLDAFASYIIVRKIAYPMDDTVGRKIIEYIRNNLSEDLSVQALCDKFYLCKAEIYKVSKRYMPGGIAHFVRNERMKKATELLLHTDATSEQIAEMVGFSDVNYFLRTFKRLKGISAGDFRKKMKDS